MFAPRSGAPSSGALRAVRAGVLGLVSALLAMSAHLAGGGGVPGVVPVLLLGAGVVLASVLLTRVRLGFPAVLATLALGQLLLHHVLTVLVVPARTAGAAFAGTRVGTPSAPSGHLHDGAGTGWASALLDASGGTVPASGQGVLGADEGLGVHQAFATHGAFATQGALEAHGVLLGAGASMAVLHVVATLLGALVVARGEAALWALVLWCRPVVPGVALPALALPADLPAGWVPPAPVVDLRRPAPAAPRGPPLWARSAVLAA